MKKNDNTPAAGAVLGAAVLTGLIVTLLAMAACAAAVLLGGLDGASIGLMADVCLGLGSFSAAFSAARRAGGSRLIWGLGAGALLFGCLVILSLAWFGEPVRVLRLCINAALTVLCAAVGGALGAQQRKRKKHRK